MKKMIALLALTLAIGSPAAAEKPLGVEEFKSVDAVAEEIVSYFPKVQGEVKSVDGGRLVIGLGAKNGLIAGVTLSLWRDGKEIIHPVTGAVIGRAEDEVGSVEVTSLTDTTCTAVALEKKKEPKAGDKARITPKKINLAILPVRGDYPTVIQGLTDRLNELGRFSILGNDKVSVFLKDRKQRDSSLIKAMNKEFTLDVVAACSVYSSEGGKLLLTVRLFYADEARPLDTIVAILDLKSKNEAFNDIKPFFAPAKDDKTGIPDLPFEAQFMAVSDFEGRGSQQFAFSDGVRVHIYRQELSGWREEWAEPPVSDSAGMQHINLDTADINGNGRPEIFVTLTQNGKVSSYVIEYRDGAYQRIAEMPGFLRILSYPGKGVLLIGRDFDPKTFYSGQTKIYGWSNGRYTAGQELPLPKGLGLYGFVIASVGEPNPVIIAFDDADRLLVYSRDIIIWKSEEIYPSIGVSVSRPASTASAVISQSVAEADISQKIRIAGRLLTLDADGDGRDELVLPKNSGKTFLSGYTQADFISLVWTGARFEQRWNIKDVGGAVLDFQIRRIEGMGAQIVALVQTPGGLLKSDHVRVQSYTTK